MAGKGIHSTEEIVGNSPADIEVNFLKAGKGPSSLIIRPAMLTFQEARKIAGNILATWSAVGEVGSLKMIDDQTIDKSYAWIFYYEAQQQTGDLDPRIALAGNGAILVSKHDGNISTFAAGLTLDEMIEEYEETYRIWKLRLPGDIRLDPRMRLHLKRFFGLNNIRFGRHKTFKKIPLTTGSKTRLTILQKSLEVCGIPTQLIPNTKYVR
ncbi:MAG TPA: hypothetical protein VHQ04_03715 [Puia sp.]|nr:hypothetical protein [Puia sp.]